ncbi:MAG: hypothetical protein H0T46_07675 [Deltaproteobacteria bacterium]|nr:hypothetical protein [Deltaproteobacteria bacterium]
MNRGPAALALLVGLSASRTTDAEPCVPQAVLAGDREAIETVGAELVKLGVVLAPASASARCPAVQATVELAREGGIAVAVKGSGQRSEGRVVSDPGVAAVWIDAWVRDDLDVAGWAPSPEPAMLAPSSPRAPAATPARDAAPSTTAPSGSVFDRFGISALYTQAYTDDTTSWTGADIGACVRFRGACIGGRVQALWQPDQMANLTAAARSDVSVLATASLPVSLGNAILSPELGLGIGRFSTKRIDGCIPDASTMPPPNCDPTDPMCVMMPPAEPAKCSPDASGADPGTGMSKALYVGDGFDTATYSPRITFGLRISVPLFKHVWLEGVASYALMPFAHATAFQAEKVPATTTADQIALPGEPSSGWILGVGLRAGVP